MSPPLDCTTTTSVTCFSLAGWFGLQRDLFEIILGKCPFVTLYFNNQFKFGPRPSTTTPANELVIDLASSTVQKTTDTIKMNKLFATSSNDDKYAGSRHHSLSLLEPD